MIGELIMKALTKVVLKSTTALLLALTTLSESQKVAAEEVSNPDNNISYIENLGLNNGLPDVGALHYEVLEAIVEQELKQQADELITNSTGKTRTPGYVNITSKVIGTKHVSGGGYAGNQPSGGTRFHTKGGFYWSNNGGPTISIGGGFAGFSFSFGLGNVSSKGSSGYITYAPNTKQYFKLYVRKNFKTQKLAIYGHPYGHQNGPKQFLYYGYTSAFTSYDAYAKAV